MKNRLSDLQFDNRFARLGNEFSKPVRPEPAQNAKLVCVSEGAGAVLGLNHEALQGPELLELARGAWTPDGAEPVSALYAGHQFGQFVPQLGDGRAILLGEVVGSGGKRWEIQLKGAGATPYSRRGDGRAVLRSCIREFLASEAMHALGIPTTRALAVAVAPEPVHRERLEPRATLLRLAATHLRFGSFEVFASRGQVDQLRTLFEFTVKNYFPDLQERARYFNEPEQVAEFLRQVALLTAKKIAHWQAVGFEHGVMNSDNFSIVGLTLDFGPYGFMESYDPGWICNHTDERGRYAYDQQPSIGLFNLKCLAYALLPLLGPEHGEKLAIEALQSYEPELKSLFFKLMSAKLGLSGDSSIQLIQKWFEMLEAGRLDWTRSHRGLSEFSRSGAQFARTHASAGLKLYDQEMSRSPQWSEWRAEYLALIEQHPNPARATQMDAINPKFVLRNWIAEQAIRKAQDEQDYTEVNRVLKLLEQPYAEHPKMSAYAQGAPDWAKNLEVSCSS